MLTTYEIENHTFFEKEDAESSHDHWRAEVMRPEGPWFKDIVPNVIKHFILAL
jgi:hypothetical protein